MDEASSVTEWLDGLKTGNTDASQKLWERYIGQVVHIAHRRLGGRPRRASDEQDIAQEVFATFYRCAEEGRFARLDDRNDLWQVLVMLTDRKAKQHLRGELADKRGAGDVRGESALHGSWLSNTTAGAGGFGNVAGIEPTPDSVDKITGLLECSLQHLPSEELRTLMVDKLMGYSDREIATQRNMSLRSVERKLQIIRQFLLREDEV
jgi:DNA-directed RNA polymerase specialized sigma24 family protein